MNVFIGGLIYEETVETLLAALTPSYPALQSARIIRDETIDTFRPRRLARAHLPAACVISAVIATGTSAR